MARREEGKPRLVLAPEMLPGRRDDDGGRGWDGGRGGGDRGGDDDGGDRFAGGMRPGRGVEVPSLGGFGSGGAGEPQFRRYDSRDVPDPAGQTLVLSQTGSFEVQGWRIPQHGLARGRQEERHSRLTVPSIPEGEAESGAGDGARSRSSERQARERRQRETGSPFEYDFRRESIRISQLGKGASGTVYKMIHVPSLTLVAAKMVPVFDPEKRHKLAEELNALYHNLTPFEDVARTRRDLESAAAEMRAGSRDGGLTLASPCPYIVSFYDAFADGGAGTVTFVMEYMNAGSLQELVDAGGTRSEAVLASVSWQVLKGIEFLHRNHQVHRDIKPCNILLNHEGDVKLADFGVSKHLEGSGSQEMMETWVGTLTYMSPERVAGEKYTYNSDIWSFGLTMLAFATGRAPFEDASSYFDVLHQLQHGEPPRLPEDRFSANACDFFRLALQRDPADRPSSEDLLRHPFLAGVEDRVLRQRAERARAMREVQDADDGGRGQDVSELAREELNEIVSKVQKYRYTLALREKLEAMPPVRKSRMRWLARQLDVPVGLVERRFGKTQERCTASLQKHVQQERARLVGVGEGVSPARFERLGLSAPDPDVEAAVENTERQRAESEARRREGRAREGGGGGGEGGEGGLGLGFRGMAGGGMAPAVSIPIYTPSATSGSAQVGAERTGDTPSLRQAPARRDRG